MDNSVPTNRTTAPSNQDTALDGTRPPRRRGWRVVDIVVAAVLAVALGLVYMAWDALSGTSLDFLNAALPGLSGLICGIWFLGGTLGGLVIRKPGAALFVELVAALVSVVGSPWGITTLYSGLAQGLGAELAFLLFGYRRFGLPVAVLSGIGAAVVEWAAEFGLMGGRAYGASYNIVYVVCLAISGAVLAGLLGWALTRALAGAGALDRFASGRA